ncbi:MAG: EAL domain-containing protein [Leptospiraceae bacterium]|nr:EAL domain-containing protein [Leptospiraceae bacterium]
MGPGEVLPYFQPVLSVADGSVYGYEVLGRRRLPDGAIESLGPFFHDEKSDLLERIEVSRHIRKQAFSVVDSLSPHQRLFVNIKPSWMWKYREHQSLPTLDMLEELGVSGNRVVIEITEDEFQGDLNDLSDMVARYRAAGCRIAVDDFNFNFMDRLIHLQPDIVKVDMALVKLIARSSEYRSLIEYIASFARDFGISVLFEGVETRRELESAVESGAEFVQGYFFAAANEHFLDAMQFQGQVRDVLQAVVHKNWNRNRNVMTIESVMNRLLSELLASMKLRMNGNGSPDPEKVDDILRGVLSGLPPKCYRIYACDEKGDQLSSNFERDAAGEFQLRAEFRHMNWSWRPYFLHNLVRMKQYGRGIISTPYRDTETKRETLTFSCPVKDGVFLFLDFELPDIPEGNGDVLGRT